MSLSISVDVVRSSDGTIDQGASLDVARLALSKLAAQHETEVGTISAAVAEVFATHESPIGMPALVSLTCSKLNVQPENFSYLSERVAEYVRDNAQDRAGDSSAFVIRKGKGGGVALRATK